MAPYLYVAPVVALMALFIYWPMVRSVQLSTLDWNFISPVKEFVGVDNYTALFKNSDFVDAARNTAIYALILVPLLVVVPLVLAALLWPMRGSRAQPVYRAVLFSPSLIAAAAAAVIWLWIFDPLEGIVTRTLVSVGEDRVDWLGNPTLAFGCIIAVAVWKVMGFNLLLYAAAFEAIPKTLLEAATLDGASAWRQLWHVRLPLITPTIFFVLVTTVIFISDEVFQIIQVLTQGGPYGSTTNLLYLLYQQGFEFFEVGSASAIAVITFAAVMSVTWLQFRYLEHRVHYG